MRYKKTEIGIPTLAMFEEYVKENEECTFDAKHVYDFYLLNEFRTEEGSLPKHTETLLRRYGKEWNRYKTLFPSQTEDNIIWIVEQSYYKILANEISKIMCYPKSVYDDVEYYERTYKRLFGREIKMTDRFVDDSVRAEIDDRLTTFFDRDFEEFKIRYSEYEDAIKEREEIRRIIKEAKKHEGHTITFEEKDKAFVFKNLKLMEERGITNADDLRKCKDAILPYQEQLKDRRWYAFRDFIKEVRGGSCEICGSKENINIHHVLYREGFSAWEYSSREVMVVCNECHKKIHNIQQDDTHINNRSKTK